ncbi:hypothetical protein [Nocardia arthritidis]|uniref:Uncharacterized protein n=1 Tax=Nocardia arthritidis TaxID=228602 RepID=A0A6G9YK15_9NOCA|nr:hypothetical protein [Nocardia arthritidis]QIS13645.1 hypothetical protein F5544_29000 [Nocardia arthritidis]
MSEMDEISRDTSGALRQILNVAHAWIQNHRATHRYAGVRRLTRKEKRDLAEALRIQVGEQRIAQAWFTKRVTDFQTEAAAVAARRSRAAYGVADDSEDWVAERDRLTGICHGIESTVHNTALSLEQRGQVVQALNAISSNPRARVEEVFPRLDTPEAAMSARAAAVRSENWLANQRRRNAELIAEDRARTEQATDPQQLAAENAELRRRIAELAQHGTPPAPTDAAIEAPFTAHVGPAGLFGLDEQDLASVPHADRPRRGRFATREQAYDWTLRQLDNYAATGDRDTTDFTAAIRRAGDQRSGEVATGPLGMVSDEITDRRAEHRRRDTSQPTAPHQNHGQATTSESTSITEQQRITAIERRLADISTDRDRLENRVGVLQRGLDAVSADRDDFRRKLDAAEAHIEELKTRNLRLANEIEQLSRVESERDRYKCERDEAVRKLVQNTPDHNRYGNRDHVISGRRSAGLGATQPTDRGGNGYGDGTDEKQRKRFAALIRRADDRALAQARGLEDVEQLPPTQRPARRDFDTAAEAYEWAKHRINSMDLGETNVRVNIVDNHAEPGHRVYIADGSPTGVLAAMNEWCAARARAEGREHHPVTTNTGNGNGHQHSARNGRADSHRDPQKSREMAEAFNDKEQRAFHEHLNTIDPDRAATLTTPDQMAGEFARWWDNGGDQAYRQDKARRDAAQPPDEQRSDPIRNTGRPSSQSDADFRRNNSNRRQRNGIERSR